MSLLRSIFVSLVMREDDPSKVDWASLLTLLLYLALAGLLVGMIIYGGLTFNFPQPR